MDCKFPKSVIWLFSKLGDPPIVVNLPKSVILLSLKLASPPIDCKFTNFSTWLL